MPEPKTYRDLAVWRESVDLVVNVYRLTESFPRNEMFGLVSQMRRAAVSIGANVAEGNTRGSTQAYINHVQIALGSVGELSALVEISRRLSYGKPEDAQPLTDRLERVGRMLSGLRAALKRRASQRSSDSRQCPSPGP